MLGETDKLFHLNKCFSSHIASDKLPVNVAIFNHCCSKVGVIRKILICKYLENTCGGMFLLLMLQVCCSKVGVIRKILICKYLENTCGGMFLLLMLQVNDMQL